MRHADVAHVLAVLENTEESALTTSAIETAAGFTERARVLRALNQAKGDGAVHRGPTVAGEYLWSLRAFAGGER